MMSAQHVTIAVDGLSANGEAALAVERALVREPGVVRVHVSAPMETVYVTYDPALCDRRRVVDAVTRAGFQAVNPGRGDGPVPTE